MRGNEGSGSREQSQGGLLGGTGSRNLPPQIGLGVGDGEELAQGSTARDSPHFLLTSPPGLSVQEGSIFLLLSPCEGRQQC